eukprot:1188722-Prorocentrum_minimum.AAC.3
MDGRVSLRSRVCSVHEQQGSMLIHNTQLHVLKVYTLSSHNPLASPGEIVGRAQAPYTSARLSCQLKHPSTEQDSSRASAAAQAGPYYNLKCRTARCH